VAEPHWMPREELRDGLGSGQGCHSCNGVTHGYSHMGLSELNACFTELLVEPAGKMYRIKELWRNIFLRRVLGSS